jgi:hypothetical protein
MKPVFSCLALSLLSLGIPVLAAPPRPVLERVASFSAWNVPAVTYRVQSFEGRTFVYSIRMGVPVEEDPETLPIREGDRVRCMLRGAAGGTRGTLKILRWRELKGFLRPPSEQAGKGGTFFFGTIVRNPTLQNRKELLAMGPEDLSPPEHGLPLADSGASLPLGPVLILGRLDETEASSSNRLEPYLEVVKWIGLGSR